MKNSRIFVIVLLALVCVAIATIAACTPDPNPSNPSDPQDHTHTFAEGWTFNDTEHWHAATCQHTTERDSVAPHDLDSDGNCRVCDYSAPAKMTFDDLVASYKSEFSEFVTTKIAPQIFGNKEVLSKSYFVSPDQEDRLEHIYILYTYKDGETNRITEIVTVTVTQDIENQDIAERDAATPTFSTNNALVFTFDAKDSYTKQDLAARLYQAAGYGQQELKLFKEVPSEYISSRAFSILVRDGNDYLIKTVSVVAEDDKDDTIMNNLGQVTKYIVDDVAFATISGQNIFIEKYALEHFEQDKEEQEITDKQIIAALEQNCKAGIYKKVLPGTHIDYDSITNERWYINEVDGKFESAFYIFNYKTSETNAYFVIGSVTFTLGITKEELVVATAVNATYAKEYVLNYNPAIQSERSELANAILTACKGAPADPDSTVILVVNGTITNSQLSIVRVFAVVEINENGAVKYELIIKQGNTENDSDYIQELEKGNYIPSDPREYPISGRKLVAEQDASADKSSASIATVLPAKRKSSEFCAN